MQSEEREVAVSLKRVAEKRAKREPGKKWPERRKTGEWDISKTIVGVIKRANVR